MDFSRTIFVTFVNGRKVEDPDVCPEWTLLEYLRRKLRLTGTKLGCGEGGCGACTVMVSKFDWKQQKIHHFAVNACLAPVCSVHGMAVTTVEGIGNIRDKLHPVQERIAKFHGSQCGFCTPGFVMSMYTLLRNKTFPTMHDLDVSFQGNLCRCTGYRPILDAFRTFTSDGTTNFKCCKETGGSCRADCGGAASGDIANQLEANSGVDGAVSYQMIDPTQELIFPPELQLDSSFQDKFLYFRGNRVEWFRPENLAQLLSIKSKYTHAKIIVGNTEVGVEVKFRNCIYPVLVSPINVDEMNGVSVIGDHVKVGAATTLALIEKQFTEIIQSMPDEKTKVLKMVVEMLFWFAGPQIRNVGSIGGNVMTASPISDLNPILMAAGVTLEVRNTAGVRHIPIRSEFFTSYRKVNMTSDEVLVNLNFPLTDSHDHCWTYKQGKRREDDISIVNCAFKVRFRPGSDTVEAAVLAFGGMAPTTSLATRTMAAIVGNRWNEELLRLCLSKLQEDFPLSVSTPGGMVKYRVTLAISLFYKFFLKVSRDLCEHLDPKLETCISLIPRKVSQNTQCFQKDIGRPSQDPVGQPIVHRSAFKQATGEALYVDDLRKVQGELYMAFVTSSQSRAQIIDVDASAALAMQGCVQFFSAKDLEPHRNSMGHGGEIFASKEVAYHGQVIGAIVAEDQRTAQAAAKRVKVTYEVQEPIVTIADAVARDSYFRKFETGSGNFDEASKDADFIIDGSVQIGGQEHFYFETQAALAIPRLEGDELEVISSTQDVCYDQTSICRVLNIPMNNVTVKTKRLGGGFGGKECGAELMSVSVAICAHKLRRPVRCMLDRDEDFVITGKRHPFRGDYSVAVSDKGVFKAMKTTLYSNAGHSPDLSCSVMDRAENHVINAYRIPCVNIRSYVCNTNLASNTAFRGFGAPQGMLICESMVDQVAARLKMEPALLRRQNLLDEGNITHYNQKLVNLNLITLWDEGLKQSNYFARKQLVERYNKENRFKKRGIYILPTLFGVYFGYQALNQGSALVLVYQGDGSVLITHGGSEMGQGLHTKVIQVASSVLSIPVSLIHIVETSSDKIPNSSPTAGSMSSDIYGGAVLDACKKIAERLAPYRQRSPDAGWHEWVKMAYQDMVSLMAVGYFGHKELSDNVRLGNKYNYYTSGVGCSEVEIDCLTGDHQVIRTDIVMDLGQSLNPAIDIGQIEGAFMQGYGMMTLEELHYSPKGVLLTRGPGSYKIPAFGDIPMELNVTLIKGTSNPRAVFSSKAVGEPPLFLSASVFFAIKDAVRAARMDNNKSTEFNFDSPATCERIRLACEDPISEEVTIRNNGSEAPWSIQVS